MSNVNNWDVSKVNVRKLACHIAAAMYHRCPSDYGLPMPKKCKGNCVACWERGLTKLDEVQNK